MVLEYELEDVRENDELKVMEISRKGLVVGIIIMDKEKAYITKNKYKEMIIK